jgi:hypothetical protein
VVRALVAPAFDLNPVPELREEFTLEVASLALTAPMDARQRQALQSALNSSVQDLPAWTDAGDALRWRDGDREYRLSLERRPARDSTALERAVLHVSTEIDGLSLQADVPLTRMAFSHFAQVVDRWNPEVTLSGDRINGRFHTNSPLWVEVRGGVGPRVTGLTTVAGRVNIAGSARAAEIFASGLETHVRRMPLPEEPVDWSAFEDEGRMHRIARDTRFVFNADGSYEWQPVGGGEPPQRLMPAGHPWLVVAEPDVELQVQGDVRGSFLLYSPSRISVTGHLRYARDPRRGSSGDFLGLVSKGYVEVAEPELTGPGDLDIAAVIFAGRQFRVRRYRRSDGGTLRVFGSVTAGSLSATEPRYTTELEFDTRLEQRRPAHFPMTDRYLIDEAEPHWTVGHASAMRVD